MTQTLSASMFVIVSVLGLIRLFSPVSVKLGLIDIPNQRKQHSGHVPLIGGICVYLSLWTAGLFLEDIPSEVLWLMASAGLLVLVGVLDDRMDISVRSRLIAQFLASITMVFGTGLFLSQPLPIDGLSDLSWYLGVPLTIFAVVGLTNAFNMLDGIDGLAGSLAIVACVSIALGQLGGGASTMAGFLFIFCAGLIGYLLVNLAITTKRKVFLGDAGSLLIGFVVSWALIGATQKVDSLLSPSFALWCVAIPVWDTFAVMIRRIRKGLSPFHADRTHLHHICVRAGLNHREALGAIVSAAILLVMFGTMIEYAMTPVASLLAFVALGGLFLYGQIRIWRLLVWVRRYKQRELGH